MGTEWSHNFVHVQTWNACSVESVLSCPVLRSSDRSSHHLLCALGQSYIVITIPVPYTRILEATAKI